MPDIIQLLPDNIANQIAAGEVIQRPSSVVKELLENAIDADADHIKLIIKDAGKTLIQVIDNGKGMSESDIRMAFGRHATSKIKSVHDLFTIKTMGFRGEALASIAAIAQVETISKQSTQTLANHLCIEGSLVQKHNKSNGSDGTSISVKNLFYNVPARRKFLKSDPVELKHILDEFQRVAIAHPNIFFSFYNNGTETYHLPKSNQKQRIVAIFGKQWNDKLVPVSEETEVANFEGFVGKADAAKKTPGEQFIFVNQRFIKSNYLNHAIKSAYEDLIPKEAYPSFFLFLTVDPANIDINVHPTKTEIKFEDERLIYNYIKVCVKHALGKYSLTPMLDFSVDQKLMSAFSLQPANKSHGGSLQTNKLHSNSGFAKSYTNTSWEEIYSSMHSIKATENDKSPLSAQSLENEAFLSGLGEIEKEEIKNNKQPFQFANSYILYQVKSGLMFVDQQAAHERILYEKYLQILTEGNKSTQKELFPRIIELDSAKASILKSILPHVNGLGFEINDFGHNSFIVNGTPSGLDNTISIDTIITSLAHHYSENQELDLKIEDNLARSMAWSSCIKKGRKLEVEEMINIIDSLFGCTMPEKSPSSKRCFIIQETQDIIKKFNS